MLLLLLPLGVCNAQRYTFRHYGFAEGLSNLNVDSMLEDRQGFFWIGTDKSLFRYDGTRFDEFGIAAGVPQSLVTSLAEDAFGQIWVGSSGGVTVFSRGRFAPIKFQDRVLTTTIGTRLALASDGSMLVATDRELLRFRSADGGVHWQGEWALSPETLAQQGSPRFKV